MSGAALATRGRGLPTPPSRFPAIAEAPERPWQMLRLACRWPAKLLRLPAASQPAFHATAAAPQRPHRANTPSPPSYKTT